MKSPEAQRQSPRGPAGDPVAYRLHKLAGIRDGTVEALMPQSALRTLPTRSELLSYRQGLAGVLALQAGWAAHIELLSDGRRQIVHLVLPGEIIAYPRPGRPLASSTVIALTPVEMGVWRISDDPALASVQREALGASDAVEQSCMINQIARIGRRSAYERLGHLLLEMRERLMLAGVATGEQFPLPLTQETIADTLGLTSVHVNRTLQQLRQERHIELRGGALVLRDPVRLMDIVDYRPLFPPRSMH